MNKELGIFPIYTGSGAEYIKPSLQFVLTGEGNVAFGWGLYGSSDRGVAEWYMMRFGVGCTLYYSDYNLDDYAEVINKYNINRYLIQKVINKFLSCTSSTDLNNLKVNFVNEITKDIDRKNFLGDIENSNRLLYFKDIVLDIINKFKCQIINDHFNLYEQRWWNDRVPRLLNWSSVVDKEILQLIMIQCMIDKVYLLLPDSFGNMDRIDKIYRQGLWEQLTGKNIYLSLVKYFNKDYKKASLFLLKSGVDGIKYPVGTLGTGHTSSWNYVSFSDDNIEVVNHWKNGVLV